MGLEDEVAERSSKKAASAAREHRALAEFHSRVSEFNAMMKAHGCEPEAVYAFEFVRQVRKGRSNAAFRGPQSGIDEYRARVVADVWFCRIDDRDWAGPDTGAAITTDGKILRWSSHISKRSSTGGLRGSGLAIENVYLGLRERRGPQYLAEPVEALGEPTPVTRPTAFSGSDGLAALAEFYLGERAERPNLYVP